MPREKILKISAVVLLILVSAGGGFLYGVEYGYGEKAYAERLKNLFGETDGRTPDVDFGPFLDAWYLIDEKYVFPDAPTEEKKLWGAVSGLVESIGDPYSVFLPPQEAKIFEEDILGNFGGVGIEIGMRDEVLTVISPLKDTPAYRAGMQAGDKIIEIDGESTAGISIEEAVSRIRGKEGTTVTLTVFRDDSKAANGGKTMKFPLVRAIIRIPTLDTEVKGGVFIIRLYNFTAQATALFDGALKEFERSGENKLIIDLRNNPGGFLDAATEIASHFLPSGTPVVIEDLGENTEERVHRSTGPEILSKIPKIVVLVNKGSASASEILAAALAENGAATLVGEKTFGKGSVQEIIPLTKDTFLKITVARWLTPERHSLSEGGIVPEIIVEMASEDRVAGKDPQEERALSILNKK